MVRTGKTAVFRTNVLSIFMVTSVIKEFPLLIAHRLDKGVMRGKNILKRNVLIWVLF